MVTAPTVRPATRGVEVDKRCVLLDGRPLFHLTATLDRSDVSLCEPDLGRWFWPHLGEMIHPGGK